MYKSDVWGRYFYSYIVSLISGAVLKFVHTYCKIYNRYFFNEEDYMNIDRDTAVALLNKYITTEHIKTHYESTCKKTFS